LPIIIDIKSFFESSKRWATLFLLLFLLFPNWLITDLVNEKKAVSEPEKKADSNNNIKKITI
jgi:hypothetical protein